MPAHVYAEIIDAGQHVAKLVVFLQTYGVPKTDRAALDLLPGLNEYLLIKQYRPFGAIIDGVLKVFICCIKACG